MKNDRWKFLPHNEQLFVFAGRDITVDVTAGVWWGRDITVDVTAGVWWGEDQSIAVVKLFRKDSWMVFTLNPFFHPREKTPKVFFLGDRPAVPGEFASPEAAIVAYKMLK